MTSPFGIEAPVAEPTTTALPGMFVVQVTDEDIALGTPGAFGCAIQRAATRHLFLNHGFRGRLVVGMKSANVNGEMSTYFHDGLLFISRFDSHLPVEPCRVTFVRR